MSFLARMRKLPEDERRTAALLVAGIVTALIAASWIGFEYSTQQGLFSPVPTSQRTNNFSNAFDQLTNAVSQDAQRLASSSPLFGTTTGSEVSVPSFQATSAETVVNQ